MVIIDIEVMDMVTILVLITYILMIILNILANALPINNVTTADVSDAYANLFTPAGITFSIWLLIYLLLLSYSIYQLKCFKDIAYEDKRQFKGIGLIFSISSLANALWILAWHYDQIGLSLLLMLLILVCLIMINGMTREMSLSLRDWFFIKLPFEVYFGWITVATIANITVYLVKLQWQGLGLSQVFWVSLAIFIGAGLAVYNIHFYKAPAYGTVIVWAYAGIILKHFSVSGHAGRYIQVIIAASIAIVMIIIADYRVIKKIKG